MKIADQDWDSAIVQLIICSRIPPVAQAASMPICIYKDVGTSLVRLHSDARRTRQTSICQHAPLLSNKRVDMPGITVSDVSPGMPYLRIQLNDRLLAEGRCRDESKLFRRYSS